MDCDSYTGYSILDATGTGYIQNILNIKFPFHILTINTRKWKMDATGTGYISTQERGTKQCVSVCCIYYQAIKEQL